jgi:hypothetical protein
MKNHRIIKAQLNGFNDLFPEPEDREQTQEEREADLRECKRIEEEHRKSGRRFIHR